MNTDSFVKNEFHHMYFSRITTVNITDNFTEQLFLKTGIFLRTPLVVGEL